MAERHKASEERQKFALPERKTIRNAVAKRPRLEHLLLHFLPAFDISVANPEYEDLGTKIQYWS